MDGAWIALALWLLSVGFLITRIVWEHLRMRSGIAELKREIAEFEKKQRARSREVLAPACRLCYDTGVFCYSAFDDTGAVAWNSTECPRGCLQPLQRGSAKLDSELAKRKIS